MEAQQRPATMGLGVEGLAMQCGPECLVLLGGVPYYNYSTMGPPNPILIMKAPKVPGP